MEQYRCPSCMQPITSPVCPYCGFPGHQPNESHQLPVGTMLRGRYQIGRVLGQGGFGITYLGWDTLLENKIAIKEYYPSGAVTRSCTQSLDVQCCSDRFDAFYSSCRARFLREAKALATFKEIPEIVDILDFFEEYNTAYIIMEYVQGMNLASYIQHQNGRLSPEETLRILKPVMEALSIVHRSGIVHRDISPDNIMLHPTGGAKLLDFGALRAVADAQVGKPLTSSTESILKHGFAPIEQYQARGNLGPWTDEYAMCATIYYCLTGRIPPDAPSRMAEGSELDWESIAGLSPAQRRTLQKGSSVLAADRYPDMDGFVSDLFSSGRGFVGSFSPTEPVYTDPPKSHRGRWVYAAIGAAAVLLVVLGAVIVSAVRKESYQASISTHSTSPTTEPVPEVIPSITPDPTFAPTIESTGAPTETTPQKGPLSEKNVGDIITFGSYEQNAVPSDGPEAINWQILEKDENSILVISVQGLDCVKYDDQTSHSANPVSWADCSLQRWLNGFFYDAAFSGEERAKIQPVTIAGKEYNVFLLTQGQAQRFFPTNQDRQCHCTEYSKDRGSRQVPGNDYCSWWWLLREEADTQVPNVNSDGKIEDGAINGEGSTVRPVIRIRFIS